ncbi:hypothetical protein [Dysgonomonas sp. BGC7]|uniref:hypothetical protein n=1 Tax=Dysgonomonas sp. BGC7 TaxID=1658008 RepID=UPI00068317F4|nr:hypothetical protein [Dysgonomonas sp. BGC7]MBD8390439.1 hypothetical protein [Dysgonomonas sp. BGC7]
MAQKKLKKYIVYLASSLFLLPSLQSKACGFYETEADYRAMMFRVSLPWLKCMQPFYYTTSSFYYLPVDNPLVSDPNGNDRYRNCLEWQVACNKKPSIDDIYVIQYDTDPASFILSYEENTLTSVFKNNSFIKYLVEEKNKDLLDYMLFAKRAELYEAGRSSHFEDWDYNRYDDGRDERGKAKSELLDKANAKLNSKLSQFLKERYAFQACRLYYQFDQYLEVVQTHEKYFGKIDQRSLMSVWAGLFKAMATPSDSIEYHRLLIHVFNNCDEKKFRCVQLFRDNFDEKELKAEELSIALVMMALKNPGRSLEQIKKAFELDENNKYIPFLIQREINKLEDWIITPLFYDKYSITNSDPFRCAYYNEWFEKYKKEHPEEYKNDEEESILQQENLITDMKYISQLKAVLLNMLPGSSSDIKNFYAISLAHLSLLEENRSDAQKYMSMISDKANPSILLQKKVESLWLAIKTQNIESDKFKDYFVKNISDLERISMPNFDNNKMLFTISLSLANEYLKRDNRVYGNLFRLKADWYNNKESDWYFSYSRNGDSYYTTVYFDINATTSDMDMLIRLLEKPNKTPFEELLCGQSLSSINAYKELKGTIAFRNNELKLAYTTFASMPQDYWRSENFSFNSYLNEDPFVPKGLKADKYRSFDYRFNKADFIKELIELEEKASQKDEKNSDYYNRLGDAYFNTTYWGNSWMMTRYSWSCNDRDYSKIDCLPEWMRNYMTAGTARRYYEKAQEKAVNEEQKAYATVMLRYIHYLNFSFRSQDYDKRLAEKYRDNLANYEYTKAYQIYRSNCIAPFITN